MAVQTYATLTAENAEFYQRTMLERLVDEVCFMKYGKKQNIPKNSGAVTSWRRLNLPAATTTAITEGVTPADTALSISKVSGTVQQFGAWSKISDFVDLVGLDPLLTETADMYGQHAAISMDTVVANIVSAGTSVNRVNNRASRATVAAGDKITAADIIKARTVLKKANVKPITLPNGNKGYLAFTNPEVIANIMGLQEWKDQNTYVDTKNREQGIAGQLYGIYFLETTLAPVFTGAGAAAIDVYGTYIIGEGAYGIPDVQGSSKPEMLVYDGGNTENPLNLYKTVGWKSAFTAVRLNETCILRLESAIA